MSQIRLNSKIIKKKKSGIPSYEVIWSDPENYFKNLIPSKQLEEVDEAKLWSTIEPQNLVAKAYPDLVSSFEQSKIKKAPKRKQKTKATVDDLENMLQNTSITETKAKKQKTTKKQTKTIDNYFKTAVLNSACMSTPKKQPGVGSFDADLSRFGDEDCLDLSELIDEITSRKPPQIVRNKLKEIDLNTSSFFISAPTDNDQFEQSLRRCDSNESDSDEDFNLNYVPLYERIKMKS